MTDFAVVGAGISGLSAAWFLRERGFSVRVFEAGSDVGGSIRSFLSQDFLVEAGPNSTLDNTDALGELVTGVGLDHRLQEANPQAKRRYILKHGELLPLPASPPAFIKTTLFSARGKLRLLAEPFIGRAKSEETIADFVRRRLGPEFLDWAIDPFVSGVYAGDPERLSVRAATAKIYALEDQYRSLIVGAIRRALQGRKSGPAPSGRLINFAGGMQTFPQGIAASLGEAVETGARVSALSREANSWKLQVDGHATPWLARRVVLAVPAYRAAELMATLSPALAEELGAIEYPPVASVAIGFKREQISHPLDGFGFLIPRREGKQTLGTLFSSTLFPDRTPPDQVLLTSFIGGARNPGVAKAQEAELGARVLQEIAPVLGIVGAPVFEKVSFWPRAIPQYNLGYNVRLGRIKQALSQLGGLYARANWVDGISLSDCVRNGRAVAQSMKADFVDLEQARQ
jgi:oxygen-dependent protoporphyrinogen oxidase